MAFNNTRTILLHGPRGMEWYCPTPARPPWEIEKRHHQEIVRDTTWAAKPFPSSQPAILGECATSGWEKRWSWTYIESNYNNGLTRHFLRRNPYGELLLREHLIGHTYRILMNAANGVLPAQPDSHWPEPHCSRPLMSLHCHTEQNDKGDLIEHYYVTCKHPNGSPDLPPKVAATSHALQKRDGSWCLLPKTETQVPESWQPANKANKNSSTETQKPVLKVLVESTPGVVKDVLKGPAAMVTNALDGCAKGAIKLWEACRSAFTNEPEKTIQEPQDQKPADEHPEVKLKGEQETVAMTIDYGNGACTEVSRSQASRSVDVGNCGNSRWSWTAIQLTDTGKTLHCLRCSPEGRLLFKKQLIGATFTVYRKNVDCTTPAEPSMVEIEEACSMTHVEIAPNTYAVVDLLPNGQPQLPKLIAHQFDLLKNPNGSWSTIAKSETQEENQIQNQTVAQEPVLRCQSKEPVLEANAEGTSAVVKNAAVKDTAKSTSNYGNGACTEVSRDQASRSGDSGNSQNHPITQSPNYPILDSLEKLISDYLVCSEAQRTVLALWILHTYAPEATPLTPYLNIYSPVEESGKTTCMAILRALCAQPWWAGGTSASTFKRRLAAEANTVLLDNWHTLFRASDKHSLTGFLLNGCDYVPDLCARIERAQKHPVDVCRFSPKAFAGMESLPPALARRSIPIVLQRRKPGEKVGSTPYLMLPPVTEKITSAMKAWAQDHTEDIARAHGKCNTQLMLGLTPHQQESARVLMALAATIGGDWPLKAYDALMEIFDDYNEGQVSSIQLLSDIRDAFAHHGNPQRLFTAELLEYLHGLDHRTYDQWNKQGDPMTPSALARVLNKHFEIYPRTQRRRKKDGKQERFKGYQLADFQEVWERYLPPLEATGGPAKEPECQGPVSIETHSQPRPTTVSANKNAGCHDVTPQKSVIKMPALKSPISPISKFKSGCQKALKSLLSRAVGMITHLLIA